jgi:hypothetical protein
MASKTDAGDNSSSADNDELNTFDLYTGSKDNTNLLNLRHEVNIQLEGTTWKEQLESPWVEATIKTSKGNKNSILNKFSDHEREENSSRADADKASTSKCDTLCCTTLCCLRRSGFEWASPAGFFLVTAKSEGQPPPSLTDRAKSGCCVCRGSGPALNKGSKMDWKVFYYPRLNVRIVRLQHPRSRVNSSLAPFPSCSFATRRKSPPA